jgi:hypothetical protein
MSTDTFQGSSSTLHHNDAKDSLASLLSTGNTLHQSDGQPFEWGGGDVVLSVSASPLDPHDLQHGRPDVGNQSLAT